MVRTLALSLLCLAVFVCHADERQGFLVGNFSDRSAFLKARITLPTSDVPARLAYELKRGSLSCLLSAELRDDQSEVSDECSGRNGVGELKCNDGRLLPLRWKLSSCRGGFGRSFLATEPTFVFGFGHDPDHALDQLEIAKHAL